MKWMRNSKWGTLQTKAHRQAGAAGKHDPLSIVDIDLGLELPVDTINGGRWPFGHTDCD